MAPAARSDSVRTGFAERPADLWVVAALATGLMPLGVLGIGGIAGIAVGVLVVLVLPGYAVVAALFPADGEIRWIQRLILSIVMSLALVPLAGLVTASLPGGFRVEAALGLLGVGTVGACGIALARRRRLPADRRLRFALDVLPPRPAGATGTDRALALLLGVAVVAATASFTMSTLAPPLGFTEFYLLNGAGGRGPYPTNLSVGEEGLVILVVVNRESRDVNYTISIFTATLAGTFNATSGRNETVEVPFAATTNIPVALQAGSETRFPYRFTMNETGEYAVRFLLYDDPGATEAYRGLRLVVRVT